MLAFTGRAGWPSHLFPMLLPSQVLQQGCYFWSQPGQCTVILLYHVSKQA